MEFTYKIENYYPYENRLFVVYTPSDTSLDPLGAWVSVTAAMTEVEIKQAVINAAPVSKWDIVKSSVAERLVGLEETTNSSAIISPPVVNTPFVITPGPLPS